MVRTPSARAHPPAHRRRIAQAGSAGHAGAIHALAFALAACRSGYAARRRARRAGNFAAVARVRSARQLLGTPDSAAARLSLRAPDTGSTVPHRSGRMGTIVAPSRDFGSDHFG